jgi:hypothetical protein
VTRRLLAGVALAAVGASAAAASLELPSFRRGMVVSCPRDGSIWGTVEMDRALAELVPLGVEWVQLHPWGRIGRDGTVSFRPIDQAEFLELGAAKVRRSGLHLAWVPHLAWWGNFEWRGEIDFGKDELAWARFFESYSRFVLAHAAAAQGYGAELLVVGLELEGTTRREREWRELIAKVRRVYSGRISYAANWDRLEWVPFWDAVDEIGVQAYFPVGSGRPDDADLRQAWRGHLDRLEALAKRHGRPVLINELGYARGELAASEPWTAALSVDPEVVALRERLLRVAVEEISKRPGIISGLFWWKWVAGDDSHDRDFSMREPEALRVLSEVWGPGPPTSRGSR